MASLDPDIGEVPPSRGVSDWVMDKIARPGFQSWASRFPFTKRQARRDAEALFDLVSGFAYSQVLLAVVELDLFELLRGGPLSIDILARRSGVAPDKMRILCQAAAALGLLKARRSDHYGLARLGAATLGVPGLLSMIRHHAVFYRDLQDPVALLRGETEPELATFWPYVRGETARQVPQETAALYSDLMAQSQGLVAEETLRILRFLGVSRLMDVGGGIGAFAQAVKAKHPGISCTVFDLPSVVAPVSERLKNAGIDTIGGSFHEPLPEGADAISLIRVLYDHADETIAELLKKAYVALPAGGQILVSEPMTGDARPTRAGDVYFALYTMAMTTGRARSPEQIAAALRVAGFTTVVKHKSDRPFVTSCVSAVKPKS